MMLLLRREVQRQVQEVATRWQVLFGSYVDKCMEML